MTSGLAVALRLPRLLTVTVAVLVVMSVALPDAAQAAGARGGAAPAPPASQTRPLTSLDEAVAAGLVDAEVAVDVRRGGSAEALVTVADDDVLEAVRTRGRRSLAGDRTAIGRMRTRYAEKKARAVRAVAGVVIEQDYEFLPTVAVTIKSAKALLRLVNDPDVSGV